MTWWRHQMETFSALLVLCEGNSPVTGEFPSQRPVMWSFDVFFDLRLNKRLSKQSRRWWFETPSCLLWRHCNDVISGKVLDSSVGVVSIEIFHKFVNNIDAKKAIGHDSLNSKFFKVYGFRVAKPYHWELLNQGYMNRVAINSMFKKDNLDKSIYRLICLWLYQKLLNV